MTVWLYILHYQRLDSEVFVLIIDIYISHDQLSLQGYLHTVTIYLYTLAMITVVTAFTEITDLQD